MFRYSRSRPPGPDSSSGAQALRRRIAGELAVLTAGTLLFLLYAPRDSALYVTMAALFAGFLAATARETRARVWGEPDDTRATRGRRSMRILAVFTAGCAALFFAWNVWRGGPVSYPHLLLALCVYFPWACLQQIIFQFYLLGRLRIVLPFAGPYLPVLLNGAAYGLVHFPKYELMLLSSVGGVIWSWCYQRDRLLLPVAASHAVLGTGYYYWVVGADLIAEITTRMTSWFY